MKKSIVKTLSAFLVLALVLSVLPMAAFAAEIEEHGDASECCENAVAPAAACTHEHMSAHFDVRDVNAGTEAYHNICEVVVYECTNCHYSYYTVESVLGTEEHTYGSEHLVPETTNTYTKACGCGYVKIIYK